MQVVEVLDRHESHSAGLEVVAGALGFCCGRVDRRTIPDVRDPGPRDLFPS